MAQFSDAQLASLKRKFVDRCKADPRCPLGLATNPKAEFYSQETQRHWQKFIVDTANRLDENKRKDDAKPAPRQGMHWTEKELQTLAYHEAQKTSIENISRILERSEYAVQCKLGIVDGILRDPRINQYMPILTATQVAKAQKKAVKQARAEMAIYPLSKSVIDHNQPIWAQRPSGHNDMMDALRYAISCTGPITGRTSSHATGPAIDLFKPTKEKQMKIETNVTLINGSKADNYSDNEIFTMINELETQISNLNKTVNKPKKLVAKIEAIEAEIQALIKIVDERPAK